MALEAGSVVARFKADTKDFERGSKNVINSLTQTDKTAQFLKRTLQVALTGAATAFAVSSASSFEQTGVALETMLGSAEAGKKMLGELSAFARRTPFDLPQVVAAGKQLLAMGASAEEVIPEMKMLGDVSAGLGVPMDRLILNFGQVRQQGRLTGRELRDFAVAGVPLIAELADMLGVTDTRVRELGEEGKISFPIVKAAFERMTSAGGTFFNLMERQANTFGGVMSNIKDNFFRLALEIMGVDSATGDIRENSLFAQLKTAGEGFQRFLDTNGIAISRTLGVMAQNAIYFGAALAGIAIGVKLAAAITGLIRILQAFQTFATLAASRALLLKVALGGVFGLISGAVTFAAIKALSSVQKQAQKTTETATGGFKDIGDAAKESLAGDTGDAADDTIEKLQDLDRQVEESKQAFTERLAEMVKSTKDSMADLKDQMADEEESFTENQNKKKQTFDRSQASMVTDHQRKVDDIKAQIEEETAKGTEADATRLAELETRLARENEDYSLQFKQLEEDYKADTEKAKVEHDKKTTELAARFTAEEELLNKHNDLVDQARDVQMKDEFEKLVASHNSELAEFDRRKAEIIKKGSEATDAIVADFGNLDDEISATGALDGIADMGDVMGEDMAKAFVEAFKKEIVNLLDIGSFSDTVAQFMLRGNPQALAEFRKSKGLSVGSGSGGGGWGDAFGGRVNAGVSGIINERGAEAFIPDQNGQIIPSHTLSSLLQRALPSMGSQGGSSGEIHIHVGAFMGKPSEAREFARIIQKEQDRMVAAGIN